MKKIILISIIIGFAALGYSYGQDNPTQTTTTTTTSTGQAGTPSVSSDDYLRGYIGFRFMPTFTSFKVRTLANGEAETKMTLGYGYGGVIGGNFSKHFGLQGEVIYSMLSQKYTDEASIVRKVDLNYLNVPVLLMFNTDVTYPVNLNVCVGPQIGINTGSSISAGSGGNSDVDTVSAAIAVKPADLGFAYGAGLDFLIGRSFSIDIGYRGVIGLVNISDNSKSVTTNQFYILDRSHVNTYAAYAGVRFRF